MSRRAFKEYQDFIQDSHFKENLDKWMDEWRYYHITNCKPFGLLDDIFDGFVEIEGKLPVYKLTELGKNFVRFKLL